MISLMVGNKRGGICLKGESIDLSKVRPIVISEKEGALGDL